MPYITEVFSCLDEFEKKMATQYSGALKIASTMEQDSLQVVYMDDKVMVGGLQRDQRPEYFFEDAKAGEVIELKTTKQFCNVVTHLSEKKKLFYLLDKYQPECMPAVQYSLHGTHSYPDRQWEFFPNCAVFVPGEIVQHQFKSLVRKLGEDKAYCSFMQISNELLADYSNWCNGEVYGFTVSVFNSSGEEINVEHSWDIMGKAKALKKMQEMMGQLAISYEVDHLMQAVAIAPYEPKELKMPFRMDKSKLLKAQVAHVHDSYIIGAQYEDEPVVLTWKQGDKTPLRTRFEEWQRQHMSEAEFLQSTIHCKVREVLTEHLLNKEHTMQVHDENTMRVARPAMV